MDRSAGIPILLFVAFVIWNCFSAVVYSYEARNYGIRSRPVDDDLIFDELLNEVSDATSSRIRFKADDHELRRRPIIEGSGDLAALADDTEVEGSGASKQPPVATPSGSDTVAKFRFSVKLPSEKYFPSLGDSSSLEFHFLGLELADRIKELFENLEGNQTVVVEKLQESGGGILATVHLASQGFEDRDAIESHLRVAFASGHVGRFSTTTDDFRFEPTTDVAKRRPTCPSDSFWCLTGGCVTLDQQCNGKPECADGSDEKNCGPKLVVVKVHPKTRTVQTGNVAEYFCGSGDLRHRVSWSKAGADLTKDSRIRQRKGRLQIKNVTDVDSGDYVCTPERSLPGSAESVSLNVIPRDDEAEDTTGDPDVEVSITLMTVIEGHDAEISCNVVDTPVVWTKYDGDLPKGHTVVKGTLHIPRATLNDSGVYECRPVGEEEDAPQTAAQVYVIPDEKLTANISAGIKRRPTVTPQNLTVTEGEPINFQCTANRTNSDVEWTRIGPPLPKAFGTAGGNLTKAKAGLNDTGTYICRHVGRKDEQVSAYLTVQPKNKTEPEEDEEELELSVSIITGFEDSPAEISCAVSDEAGAEIIWSKIDGDLPPGSSVVGGTLRIPRLAFNDTGFYECRPAGVDEEEGPQSVAQIIVLPDPAVIGKINATLRRRPKLIPANLTVAEGDPIAMQCISNRSDVEVEWIRSGLPMSKTMSTAGGNLTNPKASLGDSGHYICRHKDRKDEHMDTRIVVILGPTTTPAPTTPTTRRTTTTRSTTPRTRKPVTTTTTSTTTTTIATTTPNITEKQQEEIQQPNLTVTIGEQTQIVYVNDGEDYAIQCQAAHEGEAVEWTAEDGQPVNEDGQGRLTIQGASASNVGMFRCRSLIDMSESVAVDVRLMSRKQDPDDKTPDNTSGSDNVEVRHTGVTIVPSDIDAEEGNDVTLDCRVDGQSRVVWEKTGGSLPDGVSPYDNQLVLPAVREEDSGEYACSAIDLPVPGRATAHLRIPRRGSGDNGEEPQSDIQLYVYPGSEAQHQEGDTVVLDCLASDPSVVVEWERPSRGIAARALVEDGSEQPSTTAGRLIIESARRADSGIYTCRTVPAAGQVSVKKTIRLTVGPGGDSQVEVTRAPDRVTDRPIVPSRCGLDQATCTNGQCIPRTALCDGVPDCQDMSDETNCGNKCEPTEIRCNNGKCVQKIWVCDGENDCGDNTDEQDCATAAPGSQCSPNQFLCETGDQCYPRNFQCDGTNDCQDGSDEIGCAGPTIAVPPVPSQQVRLGETVIVTCEAVGFPVPLISWRQNWGNVPDPPRVTATSENGKGTLVIRDFQESDQGAYSCEAINNQNAIIATPDCTITLEGTVSDICQPPVFNAAARTPDECLRCFCSGITQNCRSCSLYTSEIPATNPPTLVIVDERGTPISQPRINTDSSNQEHTIENVPEILQYGTPLWALPMEFIGDRVTSYGSNLSYSVKYGPGGQPTDAADVVIGGSGGILYHRASETQLRPDEYIEYSVPFIESAWSKWPDAQPAGGLDVVTREEMMNVLQDLEYIRVRVLYDSLAQYSSIRQISLGTAVSQDGGKGLASKVEQCICPPGYDGLSCERCTSNYQKEGSRCVPIELTPEPPVTPPIQEIPAECDPNGSLYPQPDYQTGQCVCKESTTGQRCDQCKAGSFNLNSQSSTGCDVCFCSGVTQDCGPSRYYRDQITVAPQSALRDGLAITNLDRSTSYTQTADYSLGDDLVVLRQAAPDANLYWQLPQAFLGDRVTSYGGDLTVALRMDNRDRTPIHFQIFGNGIFLNYNSSEAFPSGQVNIIRAPFVESVWLREPDGQPVTREHMLMALADLEFIIVRAAIQPYDGLVGLGTISLQIAQPQYNGQEKTDAVELCNCPPGYRGSSCEDCDRGYSRTEGGLYLGLCERCDCNGHSESCDPDSGACQNCRDGTSGKNCEIQGGRPDYLEPQIDVVAGAQASDVVAGDTVRLTCDVRSQDRVQVTWTRSDRRPIPFNAVKGRDNSLTLPRVRLQDGGVYTCSVTGDRPEIQGSSTVQIYVQAPSPVTRPPFIRPTTAPPFDEQSLRVYVVPPKSKTVQVGDTVQFQCVVLSPITYTAAWTKVNGKLPSRDSDVAGVLTISNAQPRDSGTYVCTGSNIHFTATDQAQLIVRGRPSLPDTARPTRPSYPDVSSWTAPELRIEPYFLTVDEGRPAEFRCIASGNPTPRVSWERGAGMPFSSSAQIENDLLQIPNATPDDAAEYSCVASSPAGTNRATTVLYVTRAEGLPEVRVETPEINVRTGESIHLTCYGSGEPHPEIVWSREDGPLPASAIQQDGILTIDGISEPDQGLYICTAHNIKGSRQAEVRVFTYSSDRPGPTRQPDPEYQTPPNWRPDDGSVVAPTVIVSPTTANGFQGGNVEFSCDVTGNPQPTIRWFRHGGDADERHNFNDTTYAITNLLPGDRGVYVCAAEDSAGSVQASAVLEVEGREEPRLEVYPGPSQIVQPGQSAFFQCRVVGGVPQPTVSWSRADGQQLTEKTNVVERSDVISFTDISTAENGQYTCTAENQFGVASVTVDLQVQGLPRVTISPSGPVKAVEGELIELECTSDDPQVRVNWARGSALGSRVTEPQNQASLLRIQNALAQDSGVYVCVAEGDAGSSSFTVDVQVKQTPEQTGVTDSPVTDEPLPDQVTDESTASPDQPVTGQPSDDETEAPEDARTRVEPKQLSVIPGNRARFTCTDPDAGLAQIQYIWARADGEPLSNRVIQNGNFIEFDGVTEEDAGRYVCTVQKESGADSGFGDLIATEEEAAGPTTATEEPEITTTTQQPTADTWVPTKDSIIRGQRAVLKCEGLDLDQDAVVTWARREGPMPKNHYIEGTSLIIENVSEDDAGNYICSSGGRDSSTVVVISDVVPRFRGRRDSYAVVPTELNKAYFEFDMDISLRPELPDGLILYNGITSRNRVARSKPNSPDFISLGISNGYAEFRVDAGSGPTTIKSQQPIELNKWHVIRIQRNRTEVSVTIDQEEPVLGTATGQHVGLDLNSDLYVGGVPDIDQVNKNVGFAGNFVGCLGTIRIGRRVHDVLKNATTKNGMEDCKTCAQENPCQKSGVCQDALTPLGYKCLCPPGHTGNNCEEQGLRCLDGICGSGRCTDVESSFECICPWGTYGPRCKDAVEINVPSFTGKSFAAYRTPQNALIKLDMDVVFKARDSNDGIILYVGASNTGLEDYFALVIKDKMLQLLFDLGSGPAKLSSMVEIQPDSWYRIHIERSNKQAQMKINDQETVFGTAPGSLSGLNLNTRLYIGGVSDITKVAAAVKVETGFNGCVSKLEINDVKYQLADAGSVLDSANVGDCGESAACASQPCKNGGICEESGPTEYQCVCFDGFTGPDCDQEENQCSKLQPCLNGGTCTGNATSHRCDCPLFFAGTNCDAVVDIEKSIALTGNGYIELNGTLLPHVGANEADIVTLYFKTSEPNGLILWQGQKVQGGKSRDFLSLSLKDGALLFSYELGSGPAKITSAEQRFDDDQWHKVNFKRMERTGTITVDDNAQYTYSGDAQGRLNKLDTTGSIFLGGVPDIATTTMKLHDKGWTGCIRDIEIRSSGSLNLRDHAIGGRNVDLCAV